MKRSMTAFLFFACLLLGSATPSGAQTRGSAADLQKVITDAIQRHQPIADSGVAVAVLQDSKLLFAAGFGLRDRASGQKVDAQTLFATGSLTKAFTSIAVSILAEQGAIGLSVPVNQYLSNFGMQDSEAQKQITLEDVLSHRTGLPRHDALWYLAPFSRAQLLHRLRYLDPNTTPGKGFRKSYEYNSMAYSVPAFVLEAITGDTWETFIKTRILDPIGMANTNLTLDAFQASSNRAKGYFKTIELRLKDFDNIAPAAAINSNILDMANWVLLHLNHGTTASGTKVIDRTLLEKAYDGYIEIEPGAQSGLGWVIQSLQGRRLVSHTGIPDGYSAYVSFMPDNGIGVVVLTNQHYDFQKMFPALVAQEIYSHLLQTTDERTRLISDVAQVLALSASAEGPQISAVGALERSSPATNPASTTAAAISARGFTGRSNDYTGMFSHPAYGDISITMRGAIPYMSYYQAPWPLQTVSLGTLPLAPDLFLVTFRAFGFDRIVPVTFNRNADGDIDKLSLPLEKEVKQIQFLKR